MRREIVVMDCEERESFWLTLTSDYTILFAPTVHRGLSLLSEKVGLVFLSLGLPDMDGMEALDLLKEKHPAAAVIVIASCRTEETCMCMAAFRKGAWDYIKKPLKAQEILRKIGIVLNASDASRGRQDRLLSTEAIQGEPYAHVPSHLVHGVLRVKEFVARNYSESLSLSAACKMAATSKTYFCRFFKDITGHSLRSYHHVVKVRIAEELLKDKRLSVTDVAIKLGYNDSNYFSTIYKRITGISPKYRRASVRHLERDEEVLDRV